MLEHISESCRHAVVKLTVRNVQFGRAILGDLFNVRLHVFDVRLRAVDERQVIGRFRVVVDHAGMQLIHPALFLAVLTCYVPCLRVV